MRAYNTLHPVCAAITLFTAVFSGMFVFDPIISVISLIGAVLFSLSFRLAFSVGDILFYLLLFLFVTLINPVVSHNGVTPLFFMNGRAFTLEALFFGAGLGMMICAALIWFRAIGKIMTSEKYIYIFGRTLPSFALLLSVSLRYIPIVISNFREIADTKKSLGELSDESFFARVFSRIKIFFSVISLSAERSIETSYAMVSRGYQSGKRVFSEKRKLFGREKFLCAVSVSLLSAFILLGLLGVGKFYYYPELVFESGGPAPLKYILYAGICFLPFVYESTENLIWKLQLSKI